MDYNVVSVCFVFENCDSITVPEQFIGDFQLNSIRDDIVRIAANKIRKAQTLGDFFIEIAKCFDGNHIRFGLESDSTTDKITRFERLLQSDITQIVVMYENGMISHIEVPFSAVHVTDTDSGIKNKHQDVQLCDHGIRICISEKYKVQDYVKANEELGCDMLSYVDKCDANSDKNLGESPKIMNDTALRVYVKRIKELVCEKTDSDLVCSVDSCKRVYVSGILTSLVLEGYDATWVNQDVKQLLESELF